MQKVAFESHWFSGQYSEDYPDLCWMYSQGQQQSKRLCLWLPQTLLQTMLQKIKIMLIKTGISIIYHEADRFSFCC